MTEDSKPKPLVHCPKCGSTEIISGKYAEGLSEELYCNDCGHTWYVHHDGTTVMKIKFTVEVNVNEADEYRMFGSPNFICPDHKSTDEAIKKCFLDLLAFQLNHYALGDENKLAAYALVLRGKILEAVTITRPENKSQPLEGKECSDEQ